MDIDSRLAISYYTTIATIHDAHKIYLVQNINTNKIYVKKILSVYNKAIYEYLKNNPIPYTPRIYELYEDNNQLIVIEEYISGDTIEQLIEEKTIFDNIQIKTMIYQLCDIVKNFHNCNPPIIHRDIKPSNIIISPSGDLYLLDFNAAKYQSNIKEEDTTLLGTKGYAAPEQYGFGVSTAQTDIYAIGMLLNTICKSCIPPDSAIYNDFSSVIKKCIQLKPKDRYKNVSAIQNQLDIKEPIKTDMNKKLPDWCSYLPPGFQKLAPLNMLLAGAGYFFIFWLCLTLKVKDSTPSSLFIEKLFCLLMFLSIIFCSANYRNIQFSFPPCRTSNKLLHFFAVILLDILVFLSYMIVMVFIAGVIA